MEKTKDLRVGDPLAELTFCGAVNSKTHYEKVMSFITLHYENVISYITLHYKNVMSYITLHYITRM